MIGRGKEIDRTSRCCSAAEEQPAVVGLIRCRQDRHAEVWRARSYAAEVAGSAQHATIFQLDMGALRRRHPLIAAISRSG